jgi:hypothetical protein
MTIMANDPGSCEQVAFNDPLGAWRRTVESRRCPPGASAAQPRQVKIQELRVLRAVAGLFDTDVLLASSRHRLRPGG